MRLSNPHRRLRPLWQIALLLPLWPFYAAARWFVEFMDDRL